VPPQLILPDNKSYHATTRCLRRQPDRGMWLRAPVRRHL